MFDTIRYHTVKYGDTLASIAKRYYGSEDLFAVVYNANKHYIANMNQLTPLQKLAIPHLRKSIF